MHDLTGFNLKDMTECGAALRRLGEAADCMEAVAQRHVDYLHSHLLDKATGEKACVLVRFYLTVPFRRLEADQQKFATEMLGNAPASPDMKCLTLLATRGEEASWNSRGQSVGHRAIPLPSEKAVEQVPMISQLLRQFGIPPGDLLNTNQEILVGAGQRTCGVFYVPQARGSPFIPAQEQFVVPYAIQSVLGFGGALPSGNLFAIILFSRTPIPRQTAEMFSTIALNAKLAVLPHDGGRAFA